MTKILNDFPAEDFVLNVLLEEDSENACSGVIEKDTSGLNELLETKKKSVCQLHSNPHSFVCTTCSKKMCYWCTIKTSHKKHTPMFIDEANKLRDDAINGAREVGEALLSEADNILFMIDKNAADVVKTKENLNNKGSRIEGQIEEFFEMCVWELQRRRDYLKRTLMDTIETRNNWLKSQISELYTAKRKLLKIIEMLQEKDICSSKKILNNGKAQVELLQMKKIVLTCEELELEFVPARPEQISVTFQNLGELKYDNWISSSLQLNEDNLIPPPPPPRCTTTPTDGESSSGYSSGYQITSENESCDGCSEIDEEKNLAPAKMFLPRDDIIDVKFSEIIYRHFMWGKEGKEPGEFCRPWGVCCDKSGRIIVTDRGNNRIQVFGHNGNFMYDFGKMGSAPGEFSGPTGVATCPEGNILVVDSNNCRIQKFTIEGAFIFHFGNKGQGPGMFRFPWDIACNSEGQIAVSDFKNVDVQLFSKAGVCLRIFNLCRQDQPFYEKGITLRGVCFTPEGDVLVTDYYNRRILKIKKDFKSASVIGDPYTAVTCIEGPQGIACDRKGNIYVAETRFGNIKAFSPDGDIVLWSFGVQGQFALQFDRPSGICLTPNGRLIVVDFGNSRVQVL